MSPELPSRLTAAGIAVASTVVIGLGAWLLVDAGAEIEGTGQGPVTIAERPTVVAVPARPTASTTPSESPSPTGSASPGEAVTDSEEAAVEPAPVVEEPQPQPQPQVNDPGTNTGGGSTAGGTGGNAGGGTGGGTSNGGGGFVQPGGGTGPDTSTEGGSTDPAPPAQDSEVGTAG